MGSIGVVRSAGTLFGVPVAGEPRPGGVAVLGLPFDMGRHPSRVGARGGPAHVRANSLMVAEDLADLPGGVVASLGVHDLGDLDLVPSDADGSFVRIEEAVAAIAEAGATPMTIGGDGAVTLPQLRALARRHGPLTVLHVDAHTDAYPIRDGRPRFDNSNTFRHAAAEGVVDVSSSWHVGLRPTAHLGVGGPVGDAAELGYRVVTVGDLRDAGAVAIASEFRAMAQERPVYVCWDMDSFDPSIAPGVVTPAWNGLTVREAMASIEAVRGLRVVGYDINTVSPPHDIGGQTGALAAHVIGQFLRLAHAAQAGAR